MKTKFILFILICLSLHLSAQVSMTIYEDSTKNGQLIDLRPNGTENGYTWVNLGLSALWATCNESAKTPDELGNYYSWGDTTSDSCNYRYDYEEKTFSTATMPLSNDAAHINQGGDWRMPTKAEFQELIDSCSWAWVNKNGVKGFQVTSNRKKYNTQSIFLPAAGDRYNCDIEQTEYGFYLSSSVDVGRIAPGNQLFFDSTCQNVNNIPMSYYIGRSVRAVCSSNINKLQLREHVLSIYSENCDVPNRCIVDENNMQVAISAVPKNEYRKFVRWSDGNTSNPRTITVNKDTTLTANFENITQGSCGEDLTWLYQNHTLTISGKGEMLEAPWKLFTDSITNIALPHGLTKISEDAFAECVNFQEISIPATVTSIGDGAFYYCKLLKAITLPTNVSSIGDYTFADCSGLRSITCYATTPPVAGEYTFDGVSQYTKTYVLSSSLEDYQFAIGWRNLNILSIGAEETTTSDVKVEPSNNSVTITWPTTDGADSYTIVINKDGVPFCTLTFNADGQLTNIAFLAPGRGATNAVAATAVAGGYRFTITSLDPGTNYNYEVDTQDAAGKSIANYTGSFTTTGGTPTAIDQTSFPLGEDRGEACKIIKDGQLYILRDGKTYNAQGGEL